MPLNTKTDLNTPANYQKSSPFSLPIKLRLSILMFLQFFVAGSTLPIMSLYLKDYLNFSGSQVGLIMGLSAVSSIVSPILMTFIADRVISAERLLSLCHICAAAVMLAFSQQTRFLPVLLFYLTYTLITLPTNSLINAVTFHHSPSDRQKFGNIRVWGTIGWIAVAWVFSFGVLHGDVAPDAPSRLPLLLKISALTSTILSIYALCIPKKQKTKEDSERKLFPFDSLKVMLKPQVLTLSLLAMSITFIDRFYSVGTSPFLKQIGFSEKHIMPAMSLGQIPEIFAMGVLGFLLSRWGMKKVLLTGVLMEIFRFATCAFGMSKALIYASLSVHGLAYTFVFITAFISLDSFCRGRERAGVHQLFSVVAAGIGGFAGSFTAGKVTDLFSNAQGMVDYTKYWSVPLVLAFFILAALLIFLKEVKITSNQEVAPQEKDPASKAVLNAK
ncbi:MAG: MFS transporter [Chitinispirillaceae bacterium]